MKSLARILPLIAMASALEGTAGGSSQRKTGTSKAMPDNPAKILPKGCKWFEFRHPEKGIIKIAALSYDRAEKKFNKLTNKEEKK